MLGSEYIGLCLNMVSMIVFNGDGGFGFSGSLKDIVGFYEPETS